MTKEIELTQGYKTTVDDEDFEYLRQFSWCVSHGYAVRKGNGKSQILMHRVVLERKLGRSLIKGEKSDHKDRIPSNNTRDNLRVATHKQNMANRSKIANASSRFIGVSHLKEMDKWTARIGIDGHLLHLGTFSDEKAAAKEYDKWAYIYSGEFANLNFPDELKIPDNLCKHPSIQLTLLELEIAGKTVYFFNVYDEFQTVETLKS